MCCVTEAMHIHFINGNHHIKQLRAGESHKTCLINHTQSKSHHIMPLVINVLRVDTQTLTQIQTQKHRHTHTQAHKLMHAYYTVYKSQVFGDM